MENINSNKEQKFIKGKRPPWENKQWYDYIRKTQHEIPDQLEVIARYLAMMVSITLAIFISTGKEQAGQGGGLIAFGLICWILSLIGSFIIMVPMSYRFVDESLHVFKEMHRKIVRIKVIVLMVSLGLFTLALSILAFSFF